MTIANAAAVAHVNKKGGTHSPCLLAITLELWQWCLERNIMISDQHVLGKLNTIFDSESISPFSQGVRNRPVCLSPIRPASPVRPLAFGPRDSTRGCVNNGLGTLQGLRLSTFQSDPSCPKQVSQDKTDIILVALLWPAQLWWPLLLSLLFEHPIFLPSSRHLLRAPADPRRIHPMFPRLHLAVFHVSRDSTRQCYGDSPFGVPPIYKENISISLETLEWLVC